MKGLAVLLNFLIPGVGSFFVGQVGQGIAQLLIWGAGLFLCFSLIGAVIGIPIMLAAWLWAIIGAATSNPRPIQVQISHSDLRSSFPSESAPVGIGSLIDENLSRGHSSIARDYDVTKWNALIKFDNDVAAAADLVRPYGPKWVNEFAHSYLALNDKNYLKPVLEKTIAAAMREQDDLARLPKIIEEGTFKGRKWRRYDNGVVDGELLGGRFRQFQTLEEFKQYIS
jgi:TM2 domain-containing membrane protein YozV